MPIQPLHRRVALIALAAAQRYGVALAGGNALQAHGVIDRYTEDVDLFTDQETSFGDAASAVETALRDAGLTSEPLDQAGGLADVWDGIGEGLAEWEVTGAEGTITLQLAFFERLREPVQVGDLGPVLSLEDVVAGKAAALAGRAMIRDYLDIAAILRTYTVAEVIALGMRSDPGLEEADFASAGQRLDELDDLAFARYGADVAWVRRQFANWPRTAPPRRAGLSPSQVRWWQRRSHLPLSRTQTEGRSPCLRAASRP